MELRIEPYQMPERPRFNYEELEGMIREKLAIYEAAVYTDDQIQQAKADRATLNHLKKALNDERLKQERAYMAGFDQFKKQVNDLIRLIDAPLSSIDKQVKAADERRKADKAKQIEAYWGEVLQAEKVPAGICFRQIMDEKWLNASVSMATIKKAIDDKLTKAAEDLAVIRALPAYAFEAEETYLDTLDLARAVSEAHRLQEMAEKKAAREAEELEKKRRYAEASMQPTPRIEPAPVDDQPTEPLREWVSFAALLTPEEAKALGQYMKANGIKYKAVDAR